MKKLTQRDNMASRDDDETVYSDRDDDTAYTSYTDDYTYRSGDEITAYTYYYDDDETYLTRDDETTYSYYSRYSTNTEGTVPDDDNDDDGELDKIMEALKKHASSLGITDTELLRILEAQQEETPKEEVQKEEVQQEEVQKEEVQREGAKKEEHSADHNSTQSVQSEHKESGKEEENEDTTNELQPEIYLQHMLPRERGFRSTRFNIVRRSRDASKKSRFRLWPGAR